MKRLTGNTLLARKPDSLTFVRQLGHLWIVAEDMYGPRDSSWMFLGIEVLKGCWHSCTQVLQENKQLFLQLGMDAITDPTIGYYQLAHETVHLLGPSGSPALTLEEGCAEVFAEQLVEWSTGQTHYGRKAHGVASYMKAADDVRALMAAHGPRAIKQLRALEPTFGAIKAEHFEQFEGIDPALVERLLTPLPRPYGC